jgi:hypothetical protein
MPTITFADRMYVDTQTRDGLVLDCGDFETGNPASVNYKVTLKFNWPVVANTGAATTAFLAPVRLQCFQLPPTSTVSVGEHDAIRQQVQ